MSERLRAKSVIKEMNKNTRLREKQPSWLKQLLPPKTKNQQELSELEKQWIEEEEDKSFSDFNEYEQEEQEESEEDEYEIKVKNNKYEIVGTEYTYEILYEKGKVYIKFDDEKINYTDSKLFIATLDYELTEKIETIIEDYHLIEVSQVNSQLKEKLDTIQSKIEDINNYKPKYPIYNEFFKVPKSEIVYEKDREKTKMKTELKREFNKILNQSKEKPKRHLTKAKK